MKKPTSVSPDILICEFQFPNDSTEKRSGILAQSAPNIGPLFFDEIKGGDGVTRQIQWTARVEQSLDVNSTSKPLQTLVFYRESHY